MELTRTNLKIVDAYWTEYLGCSVGDFQSPIPLVLEHAQELEDYAGIFIFVKGNAIVISVPSALLKQISELTQSWTTELVLNEAFLHKALFSIQPRKFIGPAFVAYAEKLNPLTIPNANVRPLSEKDTDIIDNFRSKVEPLEWDHGGSDVRKDKVLGVFANGELAAVAGYKLWGKHIAHIAIVSRSDYRSKGFAKLAVSSSALDALENNLIPQYRTLMSNQGSMHVARALNFSHYATTLSIHL